MKTFSQRNRERCESPNGFNQQLKSWSLSDWMTAVTGEVGEAANIIKKLNRIRDRVPGNNSESETHSKLREKLADEIADVAIYLDLLAQAAGFDLESIRNAKFEKTSAKIGYKESDSSSAVPGATGPQEGKDGHTGKWRFPDAYEHIDRDGRIVPDRDSH